MEARHTEHDCERNESATEPTVELTLDGIPPFCEPITFRFRNRVNVLAGPNGCGKSTALARLAEKPFPKWYSEQAEAPNRRIELDPPDFLDDKPNVYVASTRTELDSQAVSNYISAAKKDTFAGRVLSARNIFFIGVLAVTDVMSVVLFYMLGSPIYKETGATLVVPLYLGVLHLLFISHLIPLQAIYRAKKRAVLKRELGDILGRRDDETSIFLSEGVQNAMRLVLGTGPRARKDQVAVAATRAGEIAYECTKSISRELIPEDGEADTEVLVMDGARLPGFWQPFKKIRQHKFAFDTKYSDKKLHPMFWSSGTQGPLLFIWDLALTMALHYNFEEGWESRPAVLFIDEIENHLHPTWQRRIIPTLTETFPKLHIFATTHSPFVLAGLGPGQIHRLYRDSSGTVRVESINEDTSGWRIEELLMAFMETDDPTDAKTAVSAATLRWLRHKPPFEGTAEQWRDATILDLEQNPGRSRDEETALYWLKAASPSQVDNMQWRQQHVDELRAVVSREIELGGPIPAQGEAFYERLHELLASGDLDDLEDQD